MGLLARIKVWVSGEILTASDLNAEYNNILDNGLVNTIITGSSVNVAAMRVVVDPGEVGTESLASSNDGEIKRLRNMLKEILGEAQWYVSPTRSLAAGQLSVKTADIDTNAVDNNAMGTDAVETVNILNLAVNAAKIANGAVGPSQLATSAVETLKINDAAVTRVKQEAVGEQISSPDSGGDTETTGVFVAVTNMSITITTTGRPVLVGVMPSTGADGISSFGLTNDTGGASTLLGEWQIKRDATVVGDMQLVTSTIANTENFRFPPNLIVLDATSSGTFTYTLEHKGVTGQAESVNLHLFAYEL